MSVLNPPGAPFRHLHRSVGRIPVGPRAQPSNSTSPALSDGTLLGETFRLRTVVSKSGTSLVFRYWNSYNNLGVETDGPNPIAVKASFEIVSGPGGAADLADSIIIPIYFRGSRTAVIEPGGYVDSDPLGVSVAAASIAWVRTFVSVGSLGEKWPLGITGYTSSLEGGTGAALDATDTAGALTTSEAAMYGPAAMLALPVTPPAQVIGIVGDSIAGGTGDTTPGGFIMRALNNAYSVQSMAMASTNLGQFDTPDRCRRRFAFIDPCTHIITNASINSIADGLTLYKSRSINFWTLLALRGKVWQTTITPHTTSSDSWATTGNQTVTANEATRVAVNAWYRDGAPMLDGVGVATGSNAPGTLRSGDTGHPLTGVFEIADLVETARDSGKWKSVGSGEAAAFTADGIHPTSAGHAAMAVGIDVSELV